MPEHEGFVRAITEAPDDDTPRLIYSDWLEENGDEERARFIRLQVEAAQLEEFDPRRGILEARAKQILERREPEWSSALGLNAEGNYFRRGFLDEVFLSARVFLDRGEELCRRAPVTGLELGDSSANDCKALARSALLSRLRSLTPSPEHAAVLLRSPHLRNLVRLSFSFAKAPDQVLSALEEAGSLPQLRILELDDCEFADDDIEALARLPLLASVELLDLTWNSFGSEGVASLARSPHLGNLKVLKLAENFMRVEGIRALAASKTIRTLEGLTLDSAGVSPEGARVLARAALGV